VIRVDFLRKDTLQMIIAAHVGVKSPANAFPRVGKKLTLAYL
jgi:hypothetical protein